MYVGFGTYQETVDIDKLKNAINEAVNMSDSDYDNMSLKCIEWTKEYCDWDKITNQLKEIILNEVKNG